MEALERILGMGRIGVYQSFKLVCNTRNGGKTVVMIDKHLLRLAKDPSTTTDKLIPLLGQDVTLNRLLAKHHNPTDGMLTSLSLNGNESTQKYDMTTVPREYRKLIKVVDQLGINCPQLLEDIYFCDYFDKLKKEVAMGAWGWEPIYKVVHPKKIDIRKSIANGPLFTCKGYEWPMLGDLPMAPMMQLDLKKCGRTCGIDFGDGLLQLWQGFDLSTGDDEIFIRVIPATKVESESLFPIPDFDMEVWDDLTTIAPLDWADRRYLYDDKGDDNCVQISGYKKKRFTLPSLYKITEMSSHEGMLAQIPDQCVELINTLDSLIGHSQDCWRTGTHLVGTFSGIQYDAHQRPHPLFCFENKDRRSLYNLGAGNGQIFYEKDVDGKLNFKFEWSCG